MAREDPQLKLRLTEDLKEIVTKAARDNNRSVNAEIVARLEDYPRLIQAEKQLIVSDHQRSVLSQQLEQLRVTNEYLTSVITDAAKRQQENEENSELSSIMQAMRDQLEELSRDRDDERALTEELVRSQSEVIEQLSKDRKVTVRLLKAVQNAFLDAASGDRSALDKMLSSYADGEED